MAKTSSEIPSAAKAALQRTKDRRTSVLQEVQYAEDEEYPKVDDAWDIVSSEQLIQFANDHPAKLWDWMQLIRIERDEFRDHTDRLHTVYEQCKDFEAKHTALATAHEALQSELDKAQDHVTRYRRKVLRLQQDLQDLDNKILGESGSDQDLTPTDNPLRSVSKAKKSPKLPDPPVFTNGKDPTWDDWSSKVREKMDSNADHYSTEKSRIAYVLTRLGGDAVTYTYHRREKNAANPYLTYEDILSELAETYEDSDRLENARRGLARLQMADRPFKFFIADFMKLGRASRYQDDHLIQLLREKLPARLLKPLLAYGAMVQLKTFKEVKDYITRLDNSHVHDLQLRPKAARPAASRLPRDSARKIDSGILAARKTDTTKIPVCYQCGESGHYKTSCTVAQQTPKGLKASQEARVNDAQIANMEEDDNDVDSSQSESLSDSGNE